MTACVTRAQVKVRRILHTSHVHQENGNIYVLPPLAREKYHNAFRIEVPQLPCQPLAPCCLPRSAQHSARDAPTCLSECFRLT